MKRVKTQRVHLYFKIVKEIAWMFEASTTAPRRTGTMVLDGDNVNNARTEAELRVSSLQTQNQIIHSSTMIDP
jgi:hypothetical protein